MSRYGGLERELPVHARDWSARLEAAGESGTDWANNGRTQTHSGELERRRRLHEQRDPPHRHPFRIQFAGCFEVYAAEMRESFAASLQRQRMQAIWKSEATDGTGNRGGGSRRGEGITEDFAPEKRYLP